MSPEQEGKKEHQSLTLKVLVLVLAFLFIGALDLVYPFGRPIGAAGAVTLAGSSYIDSDAEDTHTASQWVVRNSGGTVFDSGTDAVNLTSITLASTYFTGGTTYYWKVRFEDQHSYWSDYSTESSFVYPSGETATPSPTPSASSSLSSTTTSTATSSSTVSVQPNATEITVRVTPRTVIVAPDAFQEFRVKAYTDDIDISDICYFSWTVRDADVGYLGDTIALASDRVLSHTLIASSNLGEYTDVIAVSANCHGTTGTGYATVIISEDGGGVITPVPGSLTVMISPKSVIMAPNEQREFAAFVYDEDNEQINDSCVFDWTLDDSRVGSIVSGISDTISFRSGKRVGTYNDTLAVSAACNDLTGSDSATIRVSRGGGAGVGGGGWPYIDLPPALEVLGDFALTPIGAFLTALARVLLAVPLLSDTLMKVLSRPLTSLLFRPILIPKKNKRRRKGYVYDYLSKKPIASARIKVVSALNERQVFEDMTNDNGEFALLLPRGEFYLQVEAKGYKPSQLISHAKKQPRDEKRSDGYYDGVYYPEQIIKIDEATKDLFVVSVPLEPLSGTAEGRKKAKRAMRIFWSSFSIAAFLVGLALTVIIFISAPYDHFNQFCVAYYAVILIFALVVQFDRARQAGLVTDSRGAAQAMAILRLVNHDKRLVQTVVTDDKGRYNFNVSSGHYRLEVRKPGFKPLSKNIKVGSLANFANLQIVLDRQ